MKVAPYYHSPRARLARRSARISVRGAFRASRSEPRERRLVARCLDAFELGLQAIDRRRGLVVFVPGIRQVLSDHVERVTELVDVASKTGETALDLPRVLLDLKPAEPEYDHLQIGVE